jgi:hypothetical protein
MESESGEFSAASVEECTGDAAGRAHPIPSGLAPQGT